MTWSWDSFISAIVGGVFVLIGTWLTYFLESKRQDKKKEENVRSVLSSFYVDLNVLWNENYSTMGKEIENLPKGKGLFSFYPLSEKSLSIYSSNSNIIGDIKDLQLREAIVRTFGKLAAFKATINYNNSLLKKHENAVYEAMSASKRATYERDLNLYGGVISHDHSDLKENVIDLLERLKPYSRIFN